MRRLAFAVVLAGVGCTVEGPGGNGNLYQGGGGKQPTGSAQATTSTSGSSTVAATSGAGGSPGVTTSGAGGEDEEGCSPEMDDSVCVACLKQACCAEIDACMLDEACACWAACLEDGDFLDCGTCGVPNDLLDSLLICAEGCELECELTE